MEARAHDQRPIRSIRSAWPGNLSPLLPERAIITSDSGSCANWYARDLKIRRGMMCSLSGGLASMGAAVPYAIAAKFAHPDRPVIALVGDGAMQMNNMAELITVAKYWREWSDPRWIVCVFNNQDLNQVTWEQRVMEGDPKFEATQKIPDVPYHRFAELIGLRGIYVDTSGRVCIGVGGGAGVRSAGGAGSEDGSRSAAAAAAHHAGAGAQVHLGAGEGRSGRRQRADRHREGGVGIGAARARLKCAMAQAIVSQIGTLARLRDELDRCARVRRSSAAAYLAPVASRECEDPRSCVPAAARAAGDGATLRAARRLNRATGLLATSVLPTARWSTTAARSTIRRCITPLVTSALTLARQRARRRPTSAPARMRCATDDLCAGRGRPASLGTGFHIYNVSSVRARLLAELFYGAPLGAPMAILLAGLLG